MNIRSLFLLSTLLIGSSFLSFVAFAGKSRETISLKYEEGRNYQIPIVIRTERKNKTKRVLEVDLGEGVKSYEISKIDEKTKLLKDLALLFPPQSDRDFKNFYKAFNSFAKEYEVYKAVPLPYSEELFRKRRSLYIRLWIGLYQDHKKPIEERVFFLKSKVFRKMILSGDLTLASFFDFISSENDVNPLRPIKMIDEFLGLDPVLEFFGEKLYGIFLETDDDWGHGRHSYRSLNIEWSRERTAEIFNIFLKNAFLESVFDDSFITDFSNDIYDELVSSEKERLLEKIFSTPGNSQKKSKLQASIIFSSYSEFIYRKGDIFTDVRNLDFLTEVMKKAKEINLGGVATRSFSRLETVNEANIWNARVYGLLKFIIESNRGNTKLAKEGLLDALTYPSIEVLYFLQEHFDSLSLQGVLTNLEVAIRIRNIIEETRKIYIRNSTMPHFNGPYDGPSYLSIGLGAERDFNSRFSSLKKANDGVINSYKGRVSSVLPSLEGAITESKIEGALTEVQKAAHAEEGALVQKGNDKRPGPFSRACIKLGLGGLVKRFNR